MILYVCVSHPLPNQMFFYTLCKGGDVVDFYSSGGLFTTYNLHQKYFPGLYCHNFKVHLTFFPQIFALTYQILSRQTLTSRAVYTMCKKTSDLVEDGFPYSAPFWAKWSFFKKLSKNPQHDRVKTRGGVKGRLHNV